MQAVLKPASARPNAARKPAPPAPTTTASYSWSTIGYLVPSPGLISVSLARRGALVMIFATGRVEEKFRVLWRRDFES